MCNTASGGLASSSRETAGQLLTSFSFGHYEATQRFTLLPLCALITDVNEDVYDETDFLLLSHYFCKSRCASARHNGGHFLSAHSLETPLSILGPHNGAQSK